MGVVALSSVFDNGSVGDASVLFGRTSAISVPVDIGAIGSCLATGAGVATVGSNGNAGAVASNAASRDTTTGFSFMVTAGPTSSSAALFKLVLNAKINASIVAKRCSASFLKHCAITASRDGGTVGT